MHARSEVRCLVLVVFATLTNCAHSRVFCILTTIRFRRTSNLQKFITARSQLNTPDLTDLPQYQMDAAG